MDGTFPKIVLINPTAKIFGVMEKSFTEDDFTKWMNNLFDINFKPSEGELVFGNDIQPV